MQTQKYHKMIYGNNPFCLNEFPFRPSLTEDPHPPLFVHMDHSVLVNLDVLLQCHRQPPRACSLFQAFGPPRRGAS